MSKRGGQYNNYPFQVIKLLFSKIDNVKAKIVQGKHDNKRIDHTYPPSYHSVPCFKSSKSASLMMTKNRRSGQQLERPQFDFKITETIHEETDNSELETEIECPSCQSIMTLSAYDSLYYSCNECNFCLYMYL